MGTQRNRTVIVEAHDSLTASIANRVATDIFSRAMPAGISVAVSGIMSSSVNRSHFFTIWPCGSYDGRSPFEEAEVARREFFNWVADHNASQENCEVTYVCVEFGDVPAAIVKESHPDDE